MAPASVFATLPQEITLISSLIDLMKQEQGLLVNADTDGLNALTPQKSEWIQQMSRLAAQRHAALSAAGFEGAESGMDACLNAAGDKAAGENWRQLLELTRTAKELNRVNGLLINKQMTHNQELINAMRARAGAADAAVYGPSGQTSAVNSKRRLVVG